jgi:hypothetical protein
MPAGFYEGIGRERRLLAASSRFCRLHTGSRRTDQPGYKLVQGDLAEFPVLSTAECETLLEAAWSLNQYWPEPVGSSGEGADTNSRPGDDFNQRGDVRSILSRHGWTFVNANGDGNEHWRRPGKPVGTSATLKDGVFYMFSTSAAPF